LNGTNETIDATAFKNYTPELLINKMRSDRASVASNIHESMKKADADYPLEAGIRDITTYYSVNR
jgi:hypothetical protein